MRHLVSILLIILFAVSCQKSPDENLVQITKLEQQQTERMMHIPSISPIEGGKIVNRFEQQIDSLTKKPYLKKGIDIVVDHEANVFAAAAGKVVEVMKGETNNENLIIIDHGHGFQTKYSNLFEILIEQNQAVKRWMVIGKIKKSQDLPAFLHYEVIENGEPVDPEKFLFAH